MTVNVVLIWTLVGGATGLLASMLLSQVPAGVLGSTIIGILGGVIAGLVLGLVDLPFSPGIFTNVGVAFLGSVIFLAAAQKFL